MTVSSWRAAIPALCVAGVFTALAILAATAPSAEQLALTAWGVQPFRFAFLDLDTILSALRCLRLGVDVFAINPCDALGRVFDYSPLWLAAAVFPVTTGWIVPLGLGMSSAFLLSLLLVPAGRGGWQVVVMTLCALSTPVAFALERANNDLIIFALASAAAALAAGNRRARLIGYGVGLLAGLLKYYPLLLLALICRERLRVFFPVALAGAAVLLLFVFVEFEDLQRALPLIPVGRYFGDMFGVSTLPFGLVDALDLPPLLARMGLLGLVVTSLTAAVRIGLHADMSADVARLTERERIFLLTGALLILGCFFSAQNIGYRALHLLLAVPALTALATIARRRMYYRASVVILLILLWSECWRHWLQALLQRRAPWQELAPAAVDAALLSAWLVRELCWWWIVTLLAALAFNLLLNSPVGRAAMPSLAAGRRPRLQPA